MMPTFALVEVSVMLIGIGLSLLAGYLLKKDLENPIQDEKPPTLSTRGSYAPWLIGFARLAPVVCWIGDRVKRREKAEGGKGGAFGGGTKVDVWYESGLHVLGVGPFYALHKIISNGATLFTGPITSVSHPSGTSVDLGKAGVFTIYWGEPDQPVNTYLGNASRIGVESKWPTFCYIQWVNRHLGTAASWPAMEYIMERRPQSTLLTATDPWVDPTSVLDGNTYDIDGVANGVEGVGHFQLNADKAFDFPPKTIMRLAGNALSDRDLEVASVSSFIVSLGGFEFVVYTKVYPVGGLSGADANGTLRVYTSAEDDGANPAHAIADMLFEPWPHGFNLDQSFWDIDSLETLGTLTDTEELRTTWLATGGEKLEALFGAGLQDLGTFLPLDTSSGLLKFVPIRTPGGSLPNISNDHQQEVPEVISNQMERESDRIIFEFSDRKINFRKMTFNMGDDGHAAELQHQTRKKVAIRIAVNREVAEKIMERRELEIFGEGSAVTFPVNRGSRTLIPGDALTVEGEEEVMRVSGVVIDTESGVVKLTLVTDFYGVDATDFEHGKTDPPTGLEVVEPDPAFAMVEVPEYLLSSAVQTVLVPRIRAHAQISGANIYISRDNVTYNLFGSTTLENAGGTLESAMGIDEDFYQVQGPVIEILGPDIGEVLDLSGDLTAWGNGRQLAAINGEIFYVQKITALGGVRYRLDGLIRARYDTEREAHSAGDEVFIYLNDEAAPIQDILLEPEVNLYVKSQPRGVGVIPVSSIAPDGGALYGKGVRPPPIAGLRVTSPEPADSYATGTSPVIEWAYPATLGVGTGAGMQGAGTSVGQAPPAGDFRLEITTVGDVLKRTEILQDPTYTYSNANIIADLGSEIDFKVKVTQLRNGYESDTVTITVEAI
jgi:hypothetical protein